MEEAKAAYAAARKAGRKFLAENGEISGYLPILDNMLKGVVIVGEINIGYREIPLSMLAGTKTSGRSTAFAGNFMPLLEPDTEFAAKWQKLYNIQFDEGIRDPILVYQYLDKFYVQEGNKRVSVLKSVGAFSVHSQVYRLLPERNENDDEISIFYEFLDYDKRMYFEDLWFSRRGNFTKLIEIAEKYLESEPQEGLTVPSLINEIFRSFKAAYRSIDTHELNLTPGDALVEYSGVFGLPFKLPFEILQQNLKQFKGQLMVAAGKVERRIEDVEEDVSGDVDAPRSFFSFAKQKVKINIAVAYEGTPETNIWTAQHDRAISRLERKYGDKLTVKRLTNVPGVGELAYRKLNTAAVEKPSLLFTTSPNLSTSSLRYALEHPETIVLNCDVPHEGKNLHTYFSKMYDLTFLCGVLAAAMSEKGIIGYMSSAKTWDTVTTYDINAFALGARLINPRSTILDYAMSGVNNWSEHDTARAEFGKNGADIAFCRHSPDNPLDRKAFPEVYAQLYEIAPNGAPLESIAAATLDWEPFYDKMIGDALLGRTALSGGAKDNSPVHFGWGFQTGIMDIFPVYSAVGVAGRLLRVFRELLKNGGLHPFEGPIYDNQGNLRVDWGDIPTLMEIQEMSWYTYSIRGVNY